VGASLVNNNTEDQTPGQVKPSAAFPRSVQDLNPSVTSRLGLEPVFLNNLLPFNILLKVGASYANDSQNTDPASADNNKISREEIAGVDAVLEMFKALRLQAEWLGANQFGQLPFAGPNSGVYFTDKNADAVKAGQISITGDGVFGLVNRREGWYATAVLKPLNFFMADAPTLELAGRYESFIPNVHNAWMASGITPISTATFMVKCNVYNPYSVNAATLGLKWTYAGNCHTMINYTVYGPDGNFGAAGGTELALVQQQFAF
jgi:hypothetical protein